MGWVGLCLERPTCSARSSPAAWLRCVDLRGGWFCAAGCQCQSRALHAPRRSGQTRAGYLYTHVYVHAHLCVCTHVCICMYLCVHVSCCKRRSEGEPLVLPYGADVAEKPARAGRRRRRKRQGRGAGQGAAASVGAGICSWWPWWPPVCPIPPSPFTPSPFPGLPK